MKSGVHPECNITKAVCSCGKEFEICSTKKGIIHIEVCSHCHPFYTGNQKDTLRSGRAKLFQEKYGEITAEKNAQNSTKKKKNSSSTSQANANTSSTGTA